MKNLIPYFIADKFDNKENSGSLTGSVLSLDLKGFTRMTEELMKNGKYGAETLSDVINTVFEPVIRVIHENGGFVSAFIGDAITAVFPGEFSDISRASAENILSDFKKKATINVEKNRFNIEVRIGIAFGNIEWRIINSDKRSVYYFFGNTVYSAAEAQQSAEPGRYKIGKVRVKQSAKIAKPEYSKADKINLKTLKRFIPDNVITMNTTGEFREIVSVFISFDEKKLNTEAFSKFLCDRSVQYKGYLNKIDFGDKGGIALIIFGAPTAFENSPENAVSFAFDTVKTFKGLKIGIAGGTAFCGFAGSSERCEYTALGKVVNMSARLLTRCDENSIVLDEKTALFGFKNYTVKKLGSFEFKGFEGKLKIFTPERSQKNTGRSEKSIFVGRVKEINDILKFAEPIFKKSSSGIIQINGDPGIGKSKLVNAVRHQIVKRNANWFYLSCDDTLKKSFNPFVYFFNNYFGIDDSNTGPENLRLFSSKVSNLNKQMSGDGLINFEAMKYFIGRLLGIDIKDPVFERLEKKEVYENTLFSIRSFFHLQSKSLPTVIEIDDIHNIDQCSKEALEAIFRNSAITPICLIASSRFDSGGSVFDLKIKEITVTHMNLTSLDRKSVDSLAENILGSKISPALSELIWQRSSGNPFFAEQTALYLKESGGVIKKGRLLDLRSTGLVIPERISSIIISRIDKLSSELQKLIRTASVLGKEFSVKLLSAVLNKKDLSTSLDKAENEAIWDKTSEIFYIFRHALLRDTVYEMQLKKTLRELHLSTAKTIEKIYSNEIEKHLGDLAYHYEKAEIREKTKKYLDLAGDFCTNNFMNSEAEKYYTKLLGYCDTELETAIAKKNLGDVLFRQGKWKSAERILRQSFASAKRSGDPKQIIVSGISLAELIGEKGEFDKAVILFNNFLKTAEKNRLTEQKYHLYVNLGVVIRQLSAGNDKAVKYYKESLRYFKKKKYFSDITAIYDNLGVTYSNMGDYKKGEYYYKLAEGTALKHDDLFSLMNIYNNAGMVSSYRGDYKRSLDLYSKSFELALKLGIKRHEGIIFGNFAATYFYKGDYHKALEYCLKGIDNAKLLGDEVNECHIISTAGVIYRKLGQPEKSLECFEKQKELALKMNAMQLYSIAIGNIAFMFTLTGEFEKSNKMYEEAVQLSTKADDKISMAINFSNMADNYKYLKDYSRSLELYKKAIGISEEHDLKFHLVSVYCYISEVYAEMKKTKDALSYSEKCRNIALELDRKDFLFKCDLAQTLLDDSNPSAERVKFLLSLDKDSLSEEEKASLYKAVYKISGSKEFKKKALTLYTGLYKKLKYYDYKKAMEELK